MITCGILSDASIGKLFIAGAIPGLLPAGAYSLFIASRALADPAVVPRADEIFIPARRIRSLKELPPVPLLILALIGGIYMGINTPAEAACIGGVGALVLALSFRNLAWANFKDSMINAAKTTAMIRFIIVGAAFLSQALGFAGIARAPGAYIGTPGLSPYVLIFVVGLMRLFLGMILDGISIVVMTLPIAFPIVVTAGFDPLWFGISPVFMVEPPRITPPAGFSIFVIQAISGEPVGHILRATFPFFLIMIAMVVAITLFPDMVFYLPQKMIE